ncbi:MAG: AAA family ATPase [Clostridiales bacterium]|nr:AAA family ATPase [Clostridiales bacterium]
MLYLESFTFPDAERETSYIMGVRRTCYASFYPMKILSRRRFERIDFEPVTILYGGNGTGKSTALHVIAEKAKLDREAPYNRTSFFDDYVDMCCMELRRPIPPGSCIITSDDVFDHMLSLRELNEGIDRRREDVFEEYLENKGSRFQLSSMEDYAQLKRIVRARKRTQSQYVKEELGMNVRTFSNGESAFRYFTNKITEDRLYLLDEPENSLSPERQMELCQFISDSARFMGCQFVISTHSPFLLSMKGAKIYDLDSDPVDVRRWTELKNVRAYYDFFRQHQNEFDHV